MMIYSHSSCQIVYGLTYLIIHCASGFSSNSINLELAFTGPIHKDLLELSTLGKELASGFKLAVLAANKLSKSTNSTVKLSTNFQDLIKDEGLHPIENCTALANSMLPRNNLVGVVGAFSPLCTSAFQNATKIAGSHLSQISYASTLEMFSNKRLYPTLFTSCALDGSQAKAIADLVHHFRWKRVGVIATDDDYGRGLSSLFRDRAAGHSILVSTEAYFKSSSSDMELDSKLQMLKNAGTRVNILIASGHDVYRIMQRAANRKMTGDGWVWIGTDRVASMRLKDDAIVNEAASGLVAVSPKVASGVTLLNLMLDWFSKTPEDYPGIIWSSNSPAISPYVMQVYDAVMLYHKAASDLAKERKIFAGMPVDALRQEILKRLETINSITSSFTTDSGDHIYFKNSTRSIPGSYDILNYQNKIWNVVGSWHEFSPSIKVPPGKITWPGGSTSVPTDRGTPGKPMFSIGMLAPIHPGLGALSSYGLELVSAFKVAVDLINNDKNYHVELNMKINDEGLDGSLSCEQSAQELTGDGIVAVVGAYRSQCSMSAAKVLGLKSNRIPMVSYASPANQLSDKSKYKYFFRVGATDSDEHLAFLKIIEKYSFSKVGSFSSDELYSTEVEKNLFSIIENSNNTVSHGLREQFVQNSNREKIRKALLKLKSSGSRVNLISMLANDVDITYQQIKELSLAGKGHVWLATTGATTTAFKSNPQLAKDMEGLLGLSVKSGEGSQYLKLLSSWLAKGPMQYPGIVHSTIDHSTMPGTAQVFDAVNGIALALSDLVVAKKISHATADSTVKELLYKRLKGYSSLATGYPSATGLRSMYFDSNQNGPQIYDVVNLIDAKWQHIGTYAAKSSQLILNRDPLFPGRTTTPMVGGSKTYYRIAGVFPVYSRSSEASANGRLQREAFNAAINYLNSNSSFDVGFESIMIDEGTNMLGCSNLVKNISDDVIAVVGPSRSSCAHEMATTTDAVSTLPIISYSSTADELSSKNKIPSLFRTSASDRWQAEAIVMLIKVYQWKKVGMITETSMYGRGMSQSIISKLSHHGIEVTIVERVQSKSLENLSDHIKSLKAGGSAVNIIISNPSDTANIFQEAFEQGMTGKGWTWIASDGDTTTTLSQSPNLQRAMQGMLGIKPRGGHGNLFDDVLLNWKRRIDSTERLTPYLAQIIDAVIAPAVALHRLQRSQSIRDGMNTTDKRNQLISGLRDMKSAGFASATGTVFKFDSNGDGPGLYDIVNLNGDRWIEVGVFDPKKLSMTKDVVWSGGSIHFPSDQQPLSDNDQSRFIVSSSSNKGVVALAVVFGIFGVLVLAFMAYIIHRVRYRHLYMQSDVASGGLFSVLYGHSKPNASARALTNPSIIKRENAELTFARHV